MKESLLRAVTEGMDVIGQLRSPKSIAFMEQVTRTISQCFAEGGKVIVAGNGGSLCDAMHFTQELTGFFRGKRRALPAIALGCPGHLTCVGNDVGFEEIFARGVEAYGQPGDVFVGLTTSGNSPNLVRAFEVALQRGLTTVAFLGKGGGRLLGCAHHELVIEGYKHSDRIQEAHMCAIHVVIEMVEQQLFAPDREEACLSKGLAP